MVRRLASTLTLIACTWLAAGCSERAPLYAPLEAGINHGYSDQQVGPTKYAVTYEAPPLHSNAVTETQRTAEEQQRIALAYDMAMWRAAELASENGFTAFTLSDRNNTVAIERHEYTVLPDHLHCYQTEAERLVDCAPFIPPDYATGYVVIRAHVSFTIELEKTPSAASFDAQQALGKLKARYPDAEMVDQENMD